MMVIVAETPRKTAAAASCVRLAAMSTADYQHVIAVSIGGLASKQITDSNNSSKVTISTSQNIGPESFDVVSI